MLLPETILLFLALMFSLCLIPSPEMIITVTQSSMQGRLAGIMFVLGICSALAIQVIIMALGLSAIIQTSFTVFFVLKMLGVSYLLFLAFQIFIQKSLLNIQEEQATGYASLYRRGIIINLSNPMNPFFLLIVFPNFVNESVGGVFFQLLQLGVLLIATVFLSYSAISIVGDWLGKKLLQSEALQKYLSMGAGITIAGFALFLALAGQPS